MLRKIRHGKIAETEEFIKMSSLFLNEVYGNLLPKEDILKLIEFNSSETISSEIKENRYCYYLINHENNNIGIISLKEGEDSINIYQIFILKKYRKQNIAFSAIRELRRNTNKIIKIFIPESNKKLPKIVEKWGFKNPVNISRYLGDGIYVYENAYTLGVHVE